MASLPMQLLTALSVLWCPACLDAMRAAAEAAPDDVQALVQRSATSSIGIEGASGALPALPKQPVLSLPVCTAQDLADYAAEVKRVETAQVDEFKRVVEHEKHEKLLHPSTQQALLSRLWRVVQETIMRQARRTMSEGAKAFLPSIVRTESSQDNLPEVDTRELQRKVRHIWEFPGEWMEAVQSAVKKLDAELEQQVARNWTHLVEKLPGLRAPLPQDMSAEQVWPYFLKKVLPVTMLEAQPEVAEDVVAVASQLPRNVSDYELFMQAEVLPLLMKKKVPPSPEPIRTFAVPQRRCVTCEEQYGNLTWSASGSGAPTCSDLCSLVLFSCTAGFTNHCVTKLGSCLECHASTLTRLDACKGTSESSTIIDRFNRTVALIKSATQNSSTWDWAKEPVVDQVLSSLLF